MERILFVTVGKGIDQANGIAFIIHHTNPKKVVFLGSEDSKETVKLIKREYYHESNEKFDERHECDFIEYRNIFDFNSCYDNFENEILKYEGKWDISVSAFGGTKEITSSATLCAGIFKTILLNKEGEKDHEGNMKTTGYKTIKTYKTTDKINLDKLKEAFNNHRFEFAKDKLNEIHILRNKNLYQNLLEIYDLWDKFNHCKIESADFLTDKYSKSFPDLESQMDKNISALNIITNDEHDLTCYYILADLLNNACRRYREGKYDDAIARLYRSLELIGQIRIFLKYGINTSNVDIELIKKYKDNKKYNFKNKDIKKLELKKRDGEIKIGSFDTFLLLKRFNDPIGIDYLNIDQEELKYRNKSILAHGLEAKTKEEYKKYWDVVDSFVNNHMPEIKDFMDETRFPEFDINRIKHENKHC